MNKEILNKMGISTYELVEDFIFVDNKVKAVDKSDESEGIDQFLKSLDYYLNNFTKDDESALDFLNSKSLKLSELLENSQKRKQAWRNDN
tara:strand:- start:316 stop:585 length:270 start_codon:yes stop_codon:yes gene_type:complete